MIPLRVRRDGSERSLTLRVDADRRAMTEPGKLLPGLGFDLATWNADTLVHDAPAGSAGARAGLRAGDRLLAVDGQPIANRTEFIDLVSGAPGRDISIEVERGGQTLAHRGGGAARHGAGQADRPLGDLARRKGRRAGRRGWWRRIARARSTRW